jgi:hypothetical protein
MMKTVTEAEVAVVLPAAKAALIDAIDNVTTIENAIRPTDTMVIYAAFQIAMIEKAAELARLTFATSRVDFVTAASELYDSEKE